VLRRSSTAALCTRSTGEDTARFSGVLSKIHRATAAYLVVKFCCDAATRGAKISLDARRLGWVIGQAAKGSRPGTLMART
jgi:hypothetical protein